MCLERIKGKEAQDVLSCSNPGGCSADLAVEIDSPQFAGDAVSIPAALSCPSPRSAAGLLLLTGKPGGVARAREQRTRFLFSDTRTSSSRANDPSTCGQCSAPMYRGQLLRT